MQKVDRLSFSPQPDGRAPSILSIHDERSAIGCPYSGSPMVIARTDFAVSKILGGPSFRMAPSSDYLLTGAGLQRPDGLLRLNGDLLTERRRLLGPIINGKGVEKSARSTIEQIAEEVVTTMPRNGTINLSERFTEPFISRAVSSTLGVPLEDWSFLKASSEDALRVIYDQKDIDRSTKAWERLYDYYTGFMREKRINPDSGIISRMVQKLGEKDYSDDEIVSACVSVSNGFPALLPVMDVAFIELLQSPDVVKDCLANPGNWGNVVNEVLRTKAHFSALLPRIADEEVTVDDRTHEAGTVFLPSVAAATQDPSTVLYPDKFVPGQAASSNTVFGAGSHFCLGATLSKKWLKIGLSTFFSAYSSAELATPYTDLKWQEGTLSVPEVIPVNLDPNKSKFTGN
jgi:cytochrome P450